jgi:hypothetical protein
MGDELKGFACVGSERARDDGVAFPDVAERVGERWVDDVDACDGVVQQSVGVDGEPIGLAVGEEPAGVRVRDDAGGYGQGFLEQPGQ